MVLLGTENSMPDTAPPATSPAPAPEAQTSDAKQGASNLSGDQFARFLTAEPKPAAEQTKAETPAAPEPAAETEQKAPATEPEETKGEQPEETAEEADSDLSQKTSLTPEQQAILNRRIGKEVAKTKRALEKAAAAEARLQLLESQRQTTPEADKQPNVPLPTGPQPLAEIEDIQSLQVKHREAKEAVRWAEEMLDVDGVENGVQVGDRVFSKADLKNILRNAKLTMEDHIPARAAFLQQRHQAQQVAFTEFPFLKDKTSEEYMMAQEIYKSRPWLRNDPQADWIVGLGVKGWKALQAEKQAAQKAKEAPKKVEPPKPPVSQTAVSAGSSVRTAPDGGASAVAASYEKLKSKGGVSGSEFAAFLAQKDRTRNSA